ncbi:hypothetical protein HanLR1_Chr12g0434871 [Helianthus annuus]|nr:hypothetical protein HanLR1_Chr12g0434871 [Helianthus annuus]
MTPKSTSHPQQRKSFCAMDDAYGAIIDAVPLHKNLDFDFLGQNGNKGDSFSMEFQLPDFRRPIAVSVS